MHRLGLPILSRPRQLLRQSLTFRPHGGNDHKGRNGVGSDIQKASGNKELLDTRFGEHVLHLFQRVPQLLLFGGGIGHDLYKLVDKWIDFETRQVDSRYSDGLRVDKRSNRLGLHGGIVCGSGGTASQSQK